MYFMGSRDRGTLTLVVYAEGIDSRNASGFHKEVADQIMEGDKSLVLDFTRVQYVSSAGLRVLRLLAKEMSRKGGGVSIRGPAGMARDALATLRSPTLTSKFDGIIEMLD